MVALLPDLLHMQQVCVCVCLLSEGAHGLRVCLSPGNCGYVIGMSVHHRLWSTESQRKKFRRPDLPDPTKIIWCPTGCLVAGSVGSRGRLIFRCKLTVKACRRRIFQRQAYGLPSIGISSDSGLTECHPSADPQRRACVNIQRRLICQREAYMTAADMKPESDMASLGHRMNAADRLTEGV
jgi:hypothetical protein